MMEIQIRAEQYSDSRQIEALLAQASDSMPYADVLEHSQLDALRRAGGLDHCLVAADDMGQVYGCVGISPLGLSTGELGWVSLGFLAVDPTYQGYGIGSALMHAAKQWMKDELVQGCVIAGTPEYFARFGWQTCQDLQMPGLAANRLQVLLVNANEEPQAFVQYHAMAIGAVHHLNV